METPEGRRQASSYAEYYALRWGRGGLCPDQPMLRADRMPRSQLLPRSGLGPKLLKKQCAGVMSTNPFTGEWWSGRAA